MAVARPIDGCCAVAGSLGAVEGGVFEDIFQSDLQSTFGSGLIESSARMSLSCPLRPNFGHGAFRLTADVDRLAAAALGAGVLTGRAPSFDDLAEQAFQPDRVYSYGNHYVP
jgi:hypothetical protein